MKKIFALLAFLLSVGFTNGQACQSNFAYSPDSSYSNIINFSDLSLSDSSSITSYSWSFGTGDSSSEQNPEYVYREFGDFITCLTITTDSGCSSSFYDTIRIVDGSGTGNKVQFRKLLSCNDDSIRYEDVSIINDSLVRRTWFIKDRDSSNLLSATRYYPYNGETYVYLTLRLNNGSGNFTDQAHDRFYINCPNNQDSCSTKFTVTSTGCRTYQFSDSSFSLTDTFNYFSYRFGDGNSSNDPNPTHTYADPGTYVVTFFSSTNDGCWRYVKDTIVVTCDTGYVKADYHVQVVSGLEKKFVPQVGIGPLDSVIAYAWDFGDGSSSSFKSPSHTYQSPGYYSTSLIVTTLTGKKDTAYKYLQITDCNSFRADFSYIIDSTDCSRVQFLDQSSSSQIASWHWETWDGQTSNQSNPILTVQPSSRGNYIKLRVVTTEGCESEVYKLISNCNPAQCVGAVKWEDHCDEIRFFAEPRSKDGKPFSSYFWEFKDGTTSVSKDPVYVPNFNGDSFVWFNAVNVEGCQTARIKVRFTIDCDNLSDSAKQITANYLSCDSIEFSYPDSIPGATYTWNFGDGNTGNGQTVVHTYSGDGSYQLSLVINDNGALISRNMWVTVQCNLPNEVDFEADYTNGPCTERRFRETTTFHNADTTVAWHWDFGDGDTSTSEFPVHNFSTYNNIVTMTTTSVSGATESYSKLINIECLSDDCYASFTTQEITCDSIQFYAHTQLSQGATVVSYHWDFADGQTSSLQNPTHKFAIMGRYLVRLTVTSSDSCVATTQGFVEVSCPNAPCSAFYTQDSISCSTIQFYDASDSASQGPDTVVAWLWDFGDGSTSTQQNPLHTWTNNGQFYANLQVTYSNGCVSNYCESIVIDCAAPCKPDWSMTHDSINYYFTDLTVPDTTIISWNWNFGDGNNSTAQHPVHQYAQRGIYTVTLEVITASGCIASHSDTIHADANGTPDAGCQADFRWVKNSFNEIQFYDQSTGFGSSFTYAWDFGDGFTSSQQHPRHQYQTNGTYNVGLTITTPGGCTSTYYDSLQVNNVQNECFATFNVVQDSCNMFSFVNQSSAATGDSITGYYWDFGDGNTSNLEHPQHTYSTDSTFLVQLTISTASGCVKNFQVSVTSTCSSPSCEADYTYAINACSVSFTNSSFSTQQIISFEWNFGDGNTSNQEHPVHTYSSSGFYQVVLKITTADSCTSFHFEGLAIQCNTNPTCEAGFSFTSSNCSTFTFMDTSLVDSNATVTYAWDFGDGNTSAQANPSHTFNNNGSYQVCLSITTSDSCTSVICQNVQVNCTIPTCDASFTTNTGNCPFVNFTNTSSSQPGNITSYFYDFGDGTSATTANALHKYTANGTYISCLTITTSDGCSSTTCDTLVISCIPQPSCNADFSTTSNNCPSIAFNNLSTTNNDTIVSWNWQFGDGAEDSVNYNALHTYQSNGTYTVHLTIEASSGCISTYTDQVVVNCIPTVCTADFAVNAGNCPSIKFLDRSTSSANNVSQWLYDFGDGTSSGSPNPSHLYTANGTYYVSLTITTQDSCTSTYVDSVVVGCVPNPSCTADFGFNMTGCDTANFINNSSASGNIVSYAWNFGDGNTSAQANPSHIYGANGSYPVCLSITTSDSCVSTYCDTVTVNCSPQFICAAAFNYTDTNCATIDYSDASISAPSNILSYSWSFGDGGTSAQANPSHTYTANGTYITCLTIFTADSCSSTYCDTVNISCIVPTFCSADFSYVDSCQNFSFSDSSFASHAITNWQWDFGDGNSSSSPNPFHSYGANGVYPVCLTISTSAGCVNTICDTVVVNCLSGNCNANFSMDTSNSPTIQMIDMSTADSTIVAWHWTTSDGQASTQQHPAFTFVGPALIDVCLTMASADGCTDSICQSILIPANISCAASAIYDSTGVGCNISFTDMSTSNDSIVGWTWDFGDGNSSNNQNPTHGYSNAGTYVYSLSIVTASGCTDTYTDSLQVSCVGVDEEVLKFEMYPNPTTGLVNLNLAQNGVEYQVMLIDLIGQEVQLGNFNKQQVSLDLSGIANGVYQLVVITADQRKAETLILNK